MKQLFHTFSLLALISVVLWDYPAQAQIDSTTDYYTIEKTIQEYEIVHPRIYPLLNDIISTCNNHNPLWVENYNFNFFISKKSPFSQSDTNAYWIRVEINCIDTLMDANAYGYLKYRNATFALCGESRDDWFIPSERDSTLTLSHPALCEYDPPVWYWVYVDSYQDFSLIYSVKPYFKPRRRH